MVAGAFRISGSDLTGVFYGAITTVVAMFVILVVADAAVAARPNILYIMSDDHAAHAIAAYGSWLAEIAPTPNIDRLANEGALFSNAFCTNSICSPSRACVLTGQYNVSFRQACLNVFCMIGSVVVFRIWEDHHGWTKALRHSGTAGTWAGSL